jgi:hypothetical protein
MVEDEGVSKIVKVRPRGAMLLRAKHEKRQPKKGAKVCRDQWRSNSSWLKPCNGIKWISKALRG